MSSITWEVDYCTGNRRKNKVYNKTGRMVVVGKNATFYGENEKKIGTIEVNTQPWNIIRYDLKLNICGYNVDVGNPIPVKRVPQSSLATGSILNLVHQTTQTVRTQKKKLVKVRSESESSVEEDMTSANSQVRSEMKEGNKSRIEQPPVGSNQARRSTQTSRTSATQTSKTDSSVYESSDEEDIIMGSPSYSPTVSMGESSEETTHDESDHEPISKSRNKLERMYKSIDEGEDSESQKQPSSRRKIHSTNELGGEEDDMSNKGSTRSWKSYAICDLSDEDYEELQSSSISSWKSNGQASKYQADELEEDDTDFLRRPLAPSHPIVSNINSASGIFLEESQSIKETYTQ